MDAIFLAGKNVDIKPIGLGARDTLGLKKVFAFTEMILTIQQHHWKPGWLDHQIHKRFYKLSSIKEAEGRRR